MPGQITIRRRRAAATVPPGVDFSMLIMGCASVDATPLLISPLYGDPLVLAADYGIGDGVDAAAHAILRSNGNPGPPAICFYNLPASNDGGYGTLVQSGVAGTSVISTTAATKPLGAYQVRVEVVDDGNDGMGTAVGMAGIILRARVGVGGPWLPTRALGASATFAVLLADNTDTGVSFDFTASGDTLKTGDWWYVPTTPPYPDIGDIYTAGSPATGAFQAVLQSAFNFGLIAIEPPVAESDIAVISSALDYIVSRKADRRPTVLVRFRDQGAAESDSAYIAAGQTFRAACADDERICCVVGGGWLTDAIRDHVYLRSGLPAVLGMIQGMEKNPGARGERVAQHPGLTARGPLERFSIVDDSGNPVGHDERGRGGLDGPLAGKGGFLTFYHESSDGIAGTYVSEAPTLYGTGASVITLMDNRVSSGIERVLYLVSFQALQGAALTNTVGGVTTLDDDVRHAMAGAAMAAIRANYANEIQNPNDPNLVDVAATVTVSGSAITVTWYVRDRLFMYIDGIDITVGNERP